MNLNCTTLISDTVIGASDSGKSAVEKSRLETQKTASIDGLNGELELRDVDFGYSPLEKPLINKFSLHIERGHCVTVIGASDSGKLTV